MRIYLFRCKSCGHELWSQHITMNDVACEKCTVIGQWIVVDFKDNVMTEFESK